MRRCVVCCADDCSCVGAAIAKHVVTLKMPNPQSSLVMWRSDRRIYLNKDGKVVPSNSPDVHSLLVAKDGEIPLARARQLGLVRDQDITPAPVDQVDEDDDDDFEVKGLPPQAKKALQEKGLWDPSSLANHTDEELLAIDGIGPASVRTIREALGQ